MGNLRDITYRAVDTLRKVDVIAAEDTRNFRRLQREYEINTRTISYHDFNEQTRSKQIVKRLLAGETVALVSDAGTPLINDPGYRIVKACIEADILIVSLPGACAATTALVASGLPVNHFRFLGFPPRTSARRRAFFNKLRQDTSTLILYEAPHRLLATLDDILIELGDRLVSLARNLTKPDEKYQRGTVSSIREKLALEGKIRGEATLVVSGITTNEQYGDLREPAIEEIRGLLDKGVDSRTILAHVTGRTQLSRREVYRIILNLRAEEQ